jgi:hypothetical protein
MGEVHEMSDGWLEFMAVRSLESLTAEKFRRIQ